MSEFYQSIKKLTHTKVKEAAPIGDNLFFMLSDLLNYGFEIPHQTGLVIRIVPG